MNFTAIFSHYLFFTDKPETEVLNITDSAPIEGTSHSLDCNVKNARPTEITKYQWFHNGQLIQEGKTWSTESLEKSDGGEYSCSAENIPGMGNITEKINVSIWCK